MDTATTLQVVDRAKSIEELEGVAWAPPPLASYIVEISFALRRKPLCELTNEELRVGLGQHVGVKYLLPLAIERLKDNPMVEAGLYAGDLLESLLEVPTDYWQRHPHLRHETDLVTEAALDQAANCSDFWQEEILPGLREAYDRFTGKLASRNWLRPNEGAEPPPVN